MSILLRFKFLVLVSFVLLAFSVKTHAEAKKTSASWNSKMSELASQLTDLVPSLFSESESKETVDALRTKTGKIYDMTKALDQGLAHSIKPDDPDPTIKFISQRFRRDVGVALEAFKGGNVTFGKHVMRGSISNCVACHTRSHTGPQFPMVSAFNKHIGSLPWLDQVTFHSATRQFDIAYEDVLKMLNKQYSAAVKPIDIEKGARVALSIAVRVKESPDQVTRLAQAIAQSPLSGEALKRDATQWLKDANDWRAEKPEKLTSDDEMIKTAIGLTNKEGELDLTTWVPHAEIRYLRASNLMHNLLREYPKSPRVAEALYIIGVSYDVLRDIGLWSLHEAFYEACIERAPHSEIAGRCYQKYEDSVVGGFTGSSGVSVPAAIRDHLKRLKKLADSEGKSKPS